MLLIDGDDVHRPYRSQVLADVTPHRNGLPAFEYILCRCHRYRSCLLLLLKVMLVFALTGTRHAVSSHSGSFFLKLSPYLASHLSHKTYLHPDATFSPLRLVFAYCRHSSFDNYHIVYFSDLMYPDHAMFSARVHAAISCTRVSLDDDTNPIPISVDLE